MAQTAANLVDHVVAHVPVGEWMLSLPIALRLLLAAQPVLDGVYRRREARPIFDLVGMELGARAAYEPRAAVTLWKKMGQASKASPPQQL